MNLHPRIPDREPKPGQFLAVAAATGLAWLIVGIYLIQIGVIA